MMHKDFFSLHSILHKDKCVFDTPEHSPLLNEIHRAVAYHVALGWTVREALEAFLRRERIEAEA